MPNETFLRDRAQLDAIDWHALAESSATAGSATIRVWSPACATGEESYSLALLAAEAFAPADPLVHILATDGSSAALAAAARGRYPRRSARSLDEGLRARYFSGVGDDLVISPRLRRAVRFRVHDLGRDPIPPPGYGSFDLIVWRDTPARLEPAALERVLGKLEKALAPDGVLVVGCFDAAARTSGPAAPVAGGEVSPAERIRRRRALQRVIDRAPVGEGPAGAVGNSA